MYEERAGAFDPTQFWRIHHWNLQCIAARKHRQSHASEVTVAPGKKHKHETAPDKEHSKNGDHEALHARLTVADDSDHTSSDANTGEVVLHNPFEGDAMAKQLNESLGAFLARLPPSTTTVEEGPWIWIANPHSPDRRPSPDLGGFKQAGAALLGEFMGRKRKLEQASPRRTPGSITHLMRPDRDWLESAIIELAKSKHVTSGKWMVFPKPDHVDNIWATIAKATMEGRLGSSAKVQTDHRSPKPERLIGIYTHDFSDVIDVKRVLKEMKRLGLVKGEADSRPIYYKCDAYTYLDIQSNNEYKLKASMYNSRDLFHDMASKDHK